MRFLAERGYRGVTVQEALDRPAPGTVAVTFDDGFRSVLEQGHPILERFGFRATVFVTTDFLDLQAPLSWPGVDGWLEGPHESELAPLSWNDARRLTDAGWEIGAHTRTHCDLTAVSDARLAAELTGSRRRCEEELGRPCRSFAYPFGAHDQRVVEAVRSAGFAIACTVPENLASTDPLRYPRVGVYHTDGQLSFRLKVSPRVRALRRTGMAAHVGPAIRSLRRQVRRAAHRASGHRRADKTSS